VNFEREHLVKGSEGIFLRKKRSLLSYISEFYRSQTGRIQTRALEGSLDLGKEAVETKREGRKT